MHGCTVLVPLCLFLSHLRLIWQSSTSQSAAVDTVACLTGDEWAPDSHGWQT